MILFIKLISNLFLILLITPTQANQWTGKGRLYDQRSQYFVTCRLVKEKRVEPFLGEDTVKCHYRCQDYKDIKDEFVITTHSDFPCEKQVLQPRGDKRDWRTK